MLNGLNIRLLVSIRDNIMIWCVDDDDTIREIEVYTLTQTGFEARGFADGNSMLETLKTEIPELIVLDIMLPGKDGVEVLKEIRSDSQTAKIPVIMATAKGTEMDKIHGLDTGADDYLVKPFFRDELLARVHSLLRRYLSLGSASDNSGSLLQYYELTLNTELKKLYVRGDEVRLTATEYKIMSLLLSRPGRIFPAEEIYERVWEQDSYSVENTVMIHINRLRKKIELNPKKPEYLKVVWGIGYKIEK